MEPLHTPPEISSFVLLADHQSRTPASFHSGPPVLHYHSKQCKLVIFEHDLVSVPALNAIRAENSTSTSGPANGDLENGDEGKEVVVNGVDVWVTSDKFLLYNPATSKGVSIPYPSISLHAIQRLQPAGSTEEVQGLYMQIANPSTSASVSRDDDEEDSITMTVVPTPTPTPTASEPAQTPADGEGPGPGQGQGEEEVSPTQMFYTAVSACSNLHPDPILPGDEDYDVEGDGDGDEEEGEEDDPVVQSGLPPPIPGSSGWITAENMHEYFDEEGNWIAGGQEPSFPLGPGAGTVRQRDENGHDGDGDGDGDVDAGDAAGHGDGSNEETKWQRTD